MAQPKRKKTATPYPQAADVFERVADLAFNLQWTWNHDAQRLFAALDPTLWRASNHNPIKTLENLPPERRDALAKDTALVSQLEKCERQLKEHLRTKTWFARTAKNRDKRLLVAYFSSEFALHESLPQYAGGLGVLAGDHLKSASDLGVPLVGVGRLYRHGYYQQELRRDGSTRVVYPRYDFREWPLEDTGQTIAVPLARRTVYVKIWKLQVGRAALYLLDADISRNRPKDRALTHYLYGGDGEYRLQQQVLLGVAGFRALEALGVRPTVYHLNEGHAAFCGLDRLRKLRTQGKSFEKAVGIVRASTVFTTHTPVPAGHDRYPWKMVLKYLAPIGEAIDVSWDEFLGLGRENPADRKAPFCMTVLAMRLSARVNGVSKLHGEVSRKMWRSIYGAKSPAKVPIGYITNGIHTQTWLAPEIEPLYRRRLKPRWVGAGPNDNWTARADQIPPAEFWALRNTLRARLVNFIRERIVQRIQRQLGSIEDLVAAHDTFNEDALTIGFARRFTPYKRAPLIFRDSKRLAAILNDEERPVQLVFAGKAHPRDDRGQKLVQEVYRRAHAKDFAGKVVILEDYDMHISRLLISGCDVWLNTPIRPMEASGTSGMKVSLHGGLNCSILDGWWPEAYNGRNGWAIGDGRQLKTQAQQDRCEAEAIYELLENEIVPLFYRRGRDGVPKRWVRMMSNALTSAGRRFTSHRMLGEYVKEYYLPAHR
ncbi:MAG: alpha-glucan family phosphorylase [Phycisphaerae bacterium]